MTSTDLNTFHDGHHHHSHRWLTVTQAANYLGCSRAFLDQDRLTRLHSIPFTYLGRHIRYDRTDLDAWLEKNKVNSGTVSNG